ncbi:MAG: YicC family protein [Clostridiales bacterium]|nr:YicC family protein [Clostridiales bacterium]
MIRSMTGYGRYQEVIDGRDILVEIRSVNHRFYEFSARVPRAYGYLEGKLKSMLGGEITRGKVEVNVSIFNADGKEALIEANRSIAEGYVNALRNVNKELGLEDDIALSHIMRLQDVFIIQNVVDDEEEIWDCVRVVAENSLQKFLSMREIEGESLKEDILSRIDTVSGIVAAINERTPDLCKEYKEKLYSKITELLQTTNIDEQRVLTEVAIFAEKTAIDEEIVRLESHVKQFITILESGGAVGRKLDFLVQELNREINTIGSKAHDIDITRMVVEIKSEIEKIREQIQNIE